MLTNNQLKNQVNSEIRKRRLIFYTVMFLSFLYLVVSVVFSDMGLLKYRELYRKKTVLEANIRAIEHENQTLKSQIKLLKEEPFFREKYAREEFGLAKPDEYIFQYDR